MFGRDSMALPGPVDRLGRDRPGGPPLIELTFGLGEAVAAFDQTQREAACPRTSGTSSDRLLVEVLLLSLEGERKALDLAAVEGSETMADLDRVGAGGSGCPEPDRPLNRPGERAVASASVTDTDLGGDVCEIEMGHTTVFVERIGENSQHEGGRAAFLLSHPGLFHKSQVAAIDLAALISGVSPHSRPVGSGRGRRSPVRVAPLMVANRRFWGFCGASQDFFEMLPIARCVRFTLDSC